MSTTPRNNRRRKTSLLSKARWAGYAAAGAATALGTYEAAEAGIWYSGVLNNGNGVPMNAFAEGNNLVYGFDLPGGAPADEKNDLVFHHRIYGVDGGASYGLAIVNSWSNTAENPRLAKIAGVADKDLNNKDIFFADRFIYGDLIRDTSHAFQNWGTLAVSNSSRCNFREAGEWYIGFSFEKPPEGADKGGTRYGWIRVVMDGAIENSYTIMDYAYGDVGDEVLAGVPEPGSLALLATGGIGLLLWRRKRRNGKDA